MSSSHASRTRRFYSSVAARGRRGAAMARFLLPPGHPEKLNDCSKSGTTRGTTEPVASHRPRRPSCAARRRCAPIGPTADHQPGGTMTAVDAAEVYYDPYDVE